MNLILISYEIDYWLSLLIRYIDDDDDGGNQKHLYLIIYMGQFIH